MLIQKSKCLHKQNLHSNQASNPQIIKFQIQVIPKLQNSNYHSQIEWNNEIYKVPPFNLQRMFWLIDNEILNLLKTDLFNLKVHKLQV